MTFWSYFFLIIFGIVLLIVIYDRATRKYCEYSQFNFLVGKPGSGKSTYLTKIAAEAFYAGRHVFSSEKLTVTLRNPRVPRLLRFPYRLLLRISRRFRESHEDEKVSIETVVIDPKSMWRYQFPRGSVILIDEIGIVFNNRRFKEFDDRLVEHFKRYRHDGLVYWCCSQSMDCDATVRRIVSQYWLLSKRFRIFSVANRLVCTPRKIQGSAGSPSTIEDDFVEDPKFMKPVMGGMKVCFIPHWAKMFDTHDVPEDIRKRRDIDYSYLPIPYSAKEKIYNEEAALNPDAFRMKAAAILPY